jgi:hypothetical protein
MQNMGKINKQNPNYKKMEKMRDLFFKQFPKNSSFVSKNSLKSKKSILINSSLPKVESIILKQKEEPNKNSSKEVSINIYNYPNNGKQGDIPKKEISKIKYPEKSLDEIKTKIEIIKKQDKEKLNLKKIEFKVEEKQKTVSSEKIKKEENISINQEHEEKNESGKCTTFKKIPMLIKNKSSLSFVSEKDNNYYKKLKQEKFPKNLQKILPHGLDDSFITYVDPIKNYSRIKKSFHSIIPQEPPQFLTKSKLNQWIDQKSILNDLESQISKNKFSQIYKKNSHKNKNIYSFTHFEPQTFEGIEPKKFLYSKKRGDKDSSRFSKANKSVPTFSKLSNPNSKIFVKNKYQNENNLERSSQAISKLKQIVTQNKCIALGNSNLFLNSFDLSLHAFSKGNSLVSAEEKSKRDSAKTPTLKSMKGYLNLNSKKSESLSFTSSKNDKTYPSDWNFEENTLSKERHISSSQITLELSAKSFTHASALDQIKKLKNFHDFDAKLNLEKAQKIENRMDITETKPHTNESKTLTNFDLTEPSIKNPMSQFKSPENSYLQMKSTFEMEMQGILQQKESVSKQIFAKSPNIQEEEIGMSEIREGVEVGKEEEDTLHEVYPEKLDSKSHLTKNYEKKNYFDERRDNEQNNDQKMKLTEAQNLSSSTLNHIRKETIEMIECMKVKETEEEDELTVQLKKCDKSVENVNSDIFEKMIEEMLQNELWSKALKSKSIDTLSFNLTLRNKKHRKKNSDQSTRIR